MTDKVLNMNFDIKDILSELIPKVIKELISQDAFSKRLKNTALSFSIDMLGFQYNYTLTNGSDLSITQGKEDNPVVEVVLTDDKKINIKINENELFTLFMPGFAKEIILAGTSAEGLKGTEFSMVIEISESKYSYVVKDGSDFNVNEGDLENPMLRLTIDRDTLENMIKIENLDFLIGFSMFLSKEKYDACNDIKGKILFEIEDSNGDVYKMSSILNGTEEPFALFKLSMDDVRQLLRQENNPVNLFMSGDMKIEGDIAFAMATQPLFT